MATQNPSSIHSRQVHNIAEESRGDFNQKATEVIKDTIDKIQEGSADLKATVKEYVHQKPFKALGIAVLSGMALALLLRR